MRAATGRCVALCAIGAISAAFGAAGTAHADPPPAPLVQESPPFAEILVPATVDAQATRGTVVQLEPLPVEIEVAPPEPTFDGSFAGARCTGLVPLLVRWSPGWNIDRMSAIAYRESRCRPEVKNPRSSATGLMQILTSNCRYIAAQLGEPCDASRLRDPVFNVRAAAVLYRYDGYGPWAT